MDNMKRTKILLASVSFILATGLGSGIGAVASAARVDNALQLGCLINDGEFQTLDNENCDLQVDKQVSVNGGAFVEADSSADAASAHVGDTVTWKITVSGDNSGTPQGTVFVYDALPSGVSFVSYVASSGTYDTTSGDFFQNYWDLPLTSDGSSTLPATLTITSKATTVGLAQNTAEITKYDTGHCDGGCIYADADPDNNSDDAWVNVQTEPQVLGSSTTTGNVLGAGTTLTNTGVNTKVVSTIAGLLITTAIGVTVIGSNRRKPSVK
jgi:uncharacterized repeat protein (TIGR01451 family)